MDANQLADVGFYVTKYCGIVLCVFRGAEIGYWTEGDDALKELRRWNASCSFVKGLRFGNIPIVSNGQPDKSPQQRTGSHDVCGCYYELRTNSLPGISKYILLQKQIFFQRAC